MTVVLVGADTSKSDKTKTKTKFLRLTMIDRHDGVEEKTNINA